MMKDDQAENKIDDETDNRKRLAAKVLWYLPIIPRFL
jgi:hypothetical protein